MQTRLPTDVLGSAELYYLGLPLYVQTRRNAIVTSRARLHIHKQTQTHTQIRTRRNVLLGATEANTHVRVCVCVCARAPGRDSRYIIPRMRPIIARQTNESTSADFLDREYAGCSRNGLRKHYMFVPRKLWICVGLWESSYRFSSADPIGAWNGNIRSCNGDLILWSLRHIFTFAVWVLSWNLLHQQMIRGSCRIIDPHS